MSLRHISSFPVSLSLGVPLLLTFLRVGPCTEAQDLSFCEELSPPPDLSNFRPDIAVYASATSWSYLFLISPRNSYSPGSLIFSWIVAEIGELIKQFVSSVVTLCPLAVESLYYPQVGFFFLNKNNKISNIKKERKERPSLYLFCLWAAQD